MIFFSLYKYADRKYYLKSIEGIKSITTTWILWDPLLVLQQLTGKPWQVTLTMLLVRLHLKKRKSVIHSYIKAITTIPEQMSTFTRDLLNQPPNTVN